MTALAIFLCVVSQFFLVAGQILFKRAMSALPAPHGPFAAIAVEQNVGHILDYAVPDPKPRRVMIRLLVLGIATQTMWFFLWLGLLQDWPLSKIFPFEGLNPVLIVLTASVLLKERLTLESWAGIILISAGIGFVTNS